MSSVAKFMLEHQETEDSKEYQCCHYDAGNLVYESEEAR